MKKKIFICMALLFGSVTCANALPLSLLLKNKDGNGNAFQHQNGKFLEENYDTAALFSPEILDSFSKNPNSQGNSQITDDNEFILDALFGPDKLTNYGQLEKIKYAKVHPGFNDSANNSQSAPVPEPATMMLLGAGLAGLAFGARRKKRQTISD